MECVGSIKNRLQAQSTIAMCIVNVLQFWQLDLNNVLGTSESFFSTQELLAYHIEVKWYDQRQSQTSKKKIKIKKKQLSQLIPNFG